MNIGLAIKLIRIKHGYKQKQLAHKIGVTNIHLSAVENNKREPSLSLLKNITNQLGITMSQLFKNIERADDGSSA